MINPRLLLILLALFCLLCGSACSNSMTVQVKAQAEAEASRTPTDESASPTPTPSPTASLTPTQTRTLLPPPTFEPPTLTPTFTPTHELTATPTPRTDFSVEGIHGLTSPTPEIDAACVPRSDWMAAYVVQYGDTLALLSQRFGVSIDALAHANCIADRNLLSVGMALRLPSTASVNSAPLASGGCEAWQPLTPIHGANNVGSEGDIVFNWRGPRAPRYLLRVVQPDGQLFERLIDLRQNETVGLTDLPQGGLHQWSVTPLDHAGRQLACPQGGPWNFNKLLALPPVPVSHSGEAQQNTLLAVP